MGERTIANLEEQVAGLPDEERARFSRLFATSTMKGRLSLRPDQHDWITSQFSRDGETKAQCIAKIETQHIVKITNIVTLEGTLINYLRASRPMEGGQSGDLDAELEKGLSMDSFARGSNRIVDDVFDRIEGNFCRTSSNLFKYDGFHGLVIFNEYHPLRFTRDQLVDYLATANRWSLAAHRTDPRARYFFLMWNCLWKSGAGIAHGHMQMTVTCDMHYAKVEHLRRSAAQYRENTGNNYFDDLFAAHDALGLQIDFGGGVKAVANIAAIKEKEVLMRGTSLDANIANALHHVLSVYRRLGVASFNVAFYLPPLASFDDEDWSGFPVFVRAVDRGDLFNRSADVGAMELYAQSVVNSDPFRLAEELSKLPSGTSSKS